jgi:hypothetical protein
MDNDPQAAAIAIARSFLAGGHAIEDDCWSIEALRDVNSLAASIALKKNLLATMQFSLI